MGTEPDRPVRLATGRRMQRRAEHAVRRARRALNEPEVPPLTIWHRIADVYWGWVRWPFFVWFRKRGVWLLIILGALYVAAAVVLGTRWALAAQFMLGYADPFDPKVELRNDQQSLAIVLRIAGWIAVPAAVGSTAGLLAAEQKRLLYTRDPESTPTRSRTSELEEVGSEGHLLVDERPGPVAGHCLDRQALRNHKMLNWLPTPLRWGPVRY